jgi:putative zinc finger protein
MTHPEELLAEYVDGSLEQDERARVDAHLEGCEQCRDEVAAAVRARGVLVALPEVDLPEGFRADRRARRVRPAPRHGRVRRTAVAAGAVAASIAAVVGVAVLIGHNGGASPTAAPEAGSAAGGHVPAAVGTAYDAARVNALADSLAKAAGSTDTANLPNAGENFSRAKLTSPRVPIGAGAQQPTSLSLDPSACVRSGAGLPKSQVVHPNLAGTFDGKPVYIGAYRAGGSVHVVVVSRQNCSILYSATQPIG